MFFSKATKIDFSLFKEEPEKKKNLVCRCGKDLAFAESGLSELFFCNSCGYVLKRSADPEKESEAYQSKIKGKVTSVLEKVIPDISSIEKITNLYFVLRVHKQYRKQKLVGAIAACASHVMKKNKKEVSHLFNLEQRFVSAGLNLISSVLNNFVKFDILKECGKHLEIFCGALELGSEIKNLCLRTIDLSISLNISRDIPCKTRSAGCLLFIVLALNLKITDKMISKISGMQSETLSRFRKAFYLAARTECRLDGKFDAKIKNRVQIISAFLERERLILPELRQDLKIILIHKEKYVLSAF